MPGKILIVDDVATNRIVLKVKLSAACYEVLQAGDGASALSVAQRELPDLILLDYALPDLDGIEVTQRLRSLPGMRDIPVLMYSALRDDAIKLSALAAGADAFMRKPMDDATLLARIRSLLRSRDLAGSSDQPLAADLAFGALGAAGQGDGPLGAYGFPTGEGADQGASGLADAAQRFETPPRIVLVAPAPEMAMRWRGALAACMTGRFEIQSREEVLGDVAGALPDLFVVGADLGIHGSGLQFMSDLRSRSATRDAAICIVTPRGTSGIMPMAYDLGANDVIDDGFDAREFALRARAMIRRKRLADLRRDAVRQGLKLALIDPLTGLYNRRHAMPRLAAMAAAAQFTGRPCAVMVIDIDRFKEVNDRYGHPAGDAVLVEVGARLATVARAGDLLARIGGEEFLLALPDTPAAEARRIAEALRQHVASLPFPIAPDAAGVSVTVSIGLALTCAGTETTAALIDRADRALLAAKAEGRNQVTVGSPHAA